MGMKKPVSIVPAVLLGIVFLAMLGVLTIVSRAAAEKYCQQEVLRLDVVQDGQLVPTHIRVTEYCYEGVRYISIRDGLSVKWNVTENRPYLCVSTDTGVIVK